MGLLKSVNNVPGVDFYEYRDQEYYNKYLYRASFHLIGLRYTWWAESIDDIAERLDPNSRMAPHSQTERDSLSKNLDKLDAYLIWRNKHAPKKKKNKDITVRIEFNSCSVFSNDLQLLHTLDQLHPEVVVQYTEVQKSQFSGIKYFARDPKHKYRVYLKSRRVPENFIDELKDLFTKVKNLYPSPALNSWVLPKSLRTSYWKYRYTSSAHFIDYDDESTLSYLAIMHGEMLGKKYKLEKRPQPI